MKKNILMAAIVAAFNVRIKGLHAWEPKHPQPQAKTGLVVVDPDASGVNAEVKAVAQSAPVRETIGSLVTDANRAYAPDAVAAAVITNNLANRRVVIMDGIATADTIASVAAVGGVVKSAELTYDGGETKNAPMSNTIANGTGLATAINAKLAAAKPSFSMAAIINAIEDVVLADGTKDALVIVDQGNDKVLVYTGTPAQIATAKGTLGAGYDMLANFTQDASPQAAATGQFGE